MDHFFSLSSIEPDIDNVIIPTGHAAAVVAEPHLDLSAQPTLISSAAIAAAAAAAAASANPPMPYMTPVGYPAGFFGQYPALPSLKPGEAQPAFYPQYYFAPIPMPPPQVTGQDGESPGYPAGFYPATFLAPYAPQPYAPQPYPGAAMPYMLSAPPPPHHHLPPQSASSLLRPDGQPIAFAAYPPAYAKPPAPLVASTSPHPPPQRENGQEGGHQVGEQHAAPRRDPRMEGYGGAGMSSVSGHAKAG